MTEAASQDGGECHNRAGDSYSLQGPQNRGHREIEVQP